jgi:hypothetical protein
MLNIAGVAEWVDAQDLKSVRRGFGKRRSEAESPFLSCFSIVQRFRLKCTNMWYCIRLIDTSMDTNFYSWISRLSKDRAASDPSTAYRSSLDLPFGAAEMPPRDQSHPSPPWEVPVGPEALVDLLFQHSHPTKPRDPIDDPYLQAMDSGVSAEHPARGVRHQA